MKKLALAILLIGLSVGAHAVVAAKYKKKNAVTGSSKTGVVKIQAGNNIYVVAARFGNQVFDAQMVFGEKAIAKFQPMPGQSVSYDVYQLDQMGTLEGGIFRPCQPPGPNSNPNEPDCTPIRWPPSIPDQIAAFRDFVGLNPDY